MKKILLSIGWVLCATFLYAQVETDPAMEEVLEEVDVVETALPPSSNPDAFSTAPAPVAMRPVQQDQWQKAASSLNYSDDVPKQEKAAKPRDRQMPNWNWDGAFWLGFLRVLAIIILVSLIGWVIYQAVQTPSNSVVRSQDGSVITLDNLDAYIQETDLERFLREALTNHNYTQATRIYYLQIIKKLSAEEAIHWSREKTNRDYLREMSSHPQSNQFRAATHTYESVWYGNEVVDTARFSQIEGEMKGLLVN